MCTWHASVLLPCESEEENERNYFKGLSNWSLALGFHHNSIFSFAFWLKANNYNAYKKRVKVKFAWKYLSELGIMTIKEK